MVVSGGCFVDSREISLCLWDKRSVDGGREVGALCGTGFFSAVEPGGEVSGVIGVDCASPPLSLSLALTALSLVLVSCECVAAGVRGGDCMADACGEARGE